MDRLKGWGICRVGIFNKLRLTKLANAGSRKGYPFIAEITATTRGANRVVLTTFDLNERSK